MTEVEIITGNDEICQLLQFESTRVYVYKVPNTFPFEDKVNTGWTEFDVQSILFHSDWNMLIGAYNKALRILESMPKAAKELLREDKNFLACFGIRNFFIPFDGQYHISSSWIKLVDFAKWWNSVSLMIKTKVAPTT